MTPISSVTALDLFDDKGPSVCSEADTSLALVPIATGATHTGGPYCTHQFVRTNLKHHFRCSKCGIEAVEVTPGSLHL